MYGNLRDIIVFRTLTGATTFARSIRAFNVGGGGSMERLDNAGSFFGKPISRGSPDSFQRTRAARRIFESVMGTTGRRRRRRRGEGGGSYPSLIRTGGRWRESGSSRLDPHGWMTMIDSCAVVITDHEVSAMPSRFRNCPAVVSLDLSFSFFFFLTLCNLPRIKGSYVFTRPAKTCRYPAVLFTKLPLESTIFRFSISTHVA